MISTGGVIPHQETSLVTHPSVNVSWVFILYVVCWLAARQICGVSQILARTGPVSSLHQMIAGLESSSMFFGLRMDWHVTASMYGLVSNVWSQHIRHWNATQSCWLGRLYTAFTTIYNQFIHIQSEKSDPVHNNMFCVWKYGIPRFNLSNNMKMFIKF